MAKATPDAVLDTFLAAIAVSDTLYVCSGEPANYAGIAAVTLASIAMTPGNGNGDYVFADDTSGRKCTVQAQSGVSVTASGTATHIVLALAGSSLLKQVTTCTSQALTSGNTVNVPAYKIGITDPT